MPTPEALDLIAGPLRLRIDPAHGGTIRSLVNIVRGRPEPVLRLDAGSGTDVLDAACFPMVPFCNRLAPAQVKVDGRIVPLPSMPALWGPHPIHGLGWRAEWRVRTFDASNAVIQHAHDGSIWPWAYEAEQTFTLTPDALRIVLSLRNRSTSAMPYGLGLHPYFPKPPGTRLTTVLHGCWTTDSTPVPSAWRPLDPIEYFTLGRLLDEVAHDHCFTGWNGHAAITWPDRSFGVTLSTSDNARMLQLYAPQGEPFVCIEPMTHVPNMLEGPPLAPGEERSMTLRIAITPAADH